MNRMNRNLFSVSLFLSITVFSGWCFVSPAGAADAQRAGTLFGNDLFLQPIVVNGQDGQTDRSPTLDPSLLSAMLLAKDPVQAAVQFSRTQWPDGSINNNPDVVILADFKNNPGVFAASRLLLSSKSGTMLFTGRYVTPEATLNELARLRPSGLASQGGVQVIAAGDIHQRVVDQLRRLGFRTERIQAAKPEALAGAVDAYTAQLSGKYSRAVIMLPLEQKPFSSSSLRLLQENEGSILFVKRFFIPKETLQALEKRNGGSNIYIPGSLEAVSKQVERRLQRYGEVTRISGD
ncbi:hypothetical protein FHS19_000931 [Paenibacillus rhizosphaerae]|uniref:Solute-binding protein family 3/N-terminal domain-containing protein n=1 Tax=Paenibacillus rhizosphaerae TaxID=297318 RepID=A0A839TND2_9BACL|nr:hypothetical protein [Paenibacillus rhizosphaerae]MBB3126277.1 hypothetical protein [Paenibacillus rhizosphaerae]